MALNSALWQAPPPARRVRTSPPLWREMSHLSLREGLDQGKPLPSPSPPPPSLPNSPEPSKKILRGRIEKCKGGQRCLPSSKVQRKRMAAQVKETSLKEDLIQIVRERTSSLGPLHVQDSFEAVVGMMRDDQEHDSMDCPECSVGEENEFLPCLLSRFHPRHPFYTGPPLETEWSTDLAPHGGPSCDRCWGYACSFV